MGANEKYDATFYDPASGESEYVPTVEFARGGYIYDRITLGVIDGEGAKAEFDRMIAKVRAEAKAEALTEMAKMIESKAKILDPEDPTQRGARIGLITAGADLTFRANQYKENLS